MLNRHLLSINVQCRLDLYFESRSFLKLITRTTAFGNFYQGFRVALRDHEAMALKWAKNQGGDMGSP